MAIERRACSSSSSVSCRTVRRGCNDYARTLGCRHYALVADPLADLATLPPEVRETAVVDDSGEVAWPLEAAAKAINALSDAGYLVLGLDLRNDPADGFISEVPWSSYDGHD